MLKCIITSLFVVITQLTFSAVGVAKFASTTPNDNVLVGLEAGEGVRIVDGYKIETLFPGYKILKFDINNVNISNKYVYVNKESISNKVVNVLYVTGEYRVNLNITMTLDIAKVVVTQPTRPNNFNLYYDWFVYLYPKNDGKFEINKSGLEIYYAIDGLNEPDLFEFYEGECVYIQSVELKKDSWLVCIGER